MAFWIWYTIIASHYQYASLVPALDTPDRKHSAAERRSLWSCQKAGWAPPRAAPKDLEIRTWELTGGADPWCLGSCLVPFAQLRSCFFSPSKWRDPLRVFVCLSLCGSQALVCWSSIGVGWQFPEHLCLYSMGVSLEEGSAGNNSGDR